MNTMSNTLHCTCHKTLHGCDASYRSAASPGTVAMSATYFLICSRQDHSHVMIRPLSMHAVIELALRGSVAKQHLHSLHILCFIHIYAIWAVYHSNTAVFFYFGLGHMHCAHRQVMQYPSSNTRWLLTTSRSFWTEAFCSCKLTMRP